MLSSKDLPFLTEEYIEFNFGDWKVKDTAPEQVKKAFYEFLADYAKAEKEGVNL